jgi:transcriptional regulator with XRE-family HTH domain
MYFLMTLSNLFRLFYPSIYYFFIFLLYLIVYLIVNISERIAFERKQKGLTKREIAEKLGVTPAYYGRLEKRNNLLSIQQIEEIAKAIGIPPEYILVENLALSQQLEIRSTVFFETTIIAWIKESIDETLKAFNTDLRNNLLISKWEDKMKLGKILLELGKKRISAINVLLELDKLIYNYLRDWDLIISKTDDKIICTLMDADTTQVKHGFLIKKS